MDPLSLAVATAFATKGAELVASGGRDALSTLFRLVRNRFASESEGAAALEAVTDNPQQRWRTMELAAALESVMTRDPDFAQVVEEGWRRVPGTEISAVQGDVSNSFSGSAEKVVQARDVQGDIRF
ncbi:hypothetical protein [Micromonospora sp. SH-82]|uniref:hypothetical protein n=1 Tax=Micromonospora sp. SH-82 TaxID=3132938 RepID=UPI003EB6F476